MDGSAKSGYRGGVIVPRLLLLALLLSPALDAAEGFRILRGARRLSLERGTLRAEGCDGIVRLHVPPGAGARMRRMSLAPWGDALEGCEFLAGTESVKLTEADLVRVRFRDGSLRLAFRRAARPLLDRGGMLILIDRYR